MSVATLISKLKKADIKIQYLNEGLKINAPEGRLSPELISELKERKQEVIAFLQTFGEAEQYHSIARVDSQEYYDLSFAQRRLWVLDQFQEKLVAYNMAGAHVVTGLFDGEVCKKVFTTLLERHEILRTTFVSVGGEPKQRINSPQEYPFRMDFFDLRNEVYKQDTVKLIAEEEINSPFDLKTGPLIRVKVLFVEEDKTILLFSLHHIISDGWSMSILLKEIAILYDLYANNQPNPFPPLKIQYKDYAAWHAGQLSSRNVLHHRKFWMDLLRGKLPVINLPTYSSRPPVQTFNGRAVTFSYPIEICARLNALSKKHGASLFMTLLSVLNVLLYKYTNQTDIIMGTDAAARLHKDLEHNIGFYLDALVLRTQFNEHIRFCDLLGMVRDNTLNAYEHQIYPLDYLIEDLNIERDLSRNPLFDVLVIMQNYGDRSYDKNLNMENVSEGISSYQVDLGIKSSLVDLEFTFKEADGNLKMSIRYNTDLFTNALINRMGKQFGRLLSAILENPQQVIGKYSFFSSEELKLLKNEYSYQPVYYPTSSVVDLFEKQASIHPLHTAVVFDQQQMTYSELNEHANQLAYVLRESLGCMKGDKIGIMLRPSSRVIIGLLAVLKAGCTYVPIDPDFPVNRIQFIINDCDVLHIITDSLSSISGLKVGTILYDHLSQNFAGVPSGNASRDVSPEDVAYINYTSGSTGIPKGVIIAHSALTDYVCTFINYFGLLSSDVVIQQSSIAFDTMIEEIFPALCSSARIVIVKDGGKDVDALLNAIREEGATVLSTTPAVINEINKELLLPESLRILISGGDTLKSSYIDHIVGNISLYNTYGPTESTVCATYNKVQNLSEASVIGKPLPNHKVYILNDSLNLVPLEVTGELYISGKGLAKGYVNQARETAAKFISNPFSSEEFLYKTGDLGKWREDGRIEFIGRKDNQTKIRGYRIELSEIENTLLKHSHIEDVVVVAVEKNESTYLAAYYVGKDAADLTDLDIFSSLHLPNYMVPSVFIRLDQLPLTSTGKIDRTALQNSDNYITSVDNFDRSLTPTEEVLQEIWKSVLGLEKVGLFNNFFALGGHSIKAMRVLSRVEKELHVKIELRNVFKNPTIRELALCIESLKSSISETAPETLAVQQFYDVSHGQKGLYLKYKYKKEKLPFNMGWQFILNNANIEAFEKAFEEIVKRHENLRSTFAMVDGEVKQRIKSYQDWKSSLQHIDLRSTEDIERVIKFHMQESKNILFDMERGPLFDIKLLHLPQGRVVSIISIDHIISDAWSMGILMKQFYAFYNSFIYNVPADLPELKIQQKEYAAWQKQYLSSERAHEHQAYWRKKLENLQVLNLPVDQQILSEERSYRKVLLQEVQQHFEPLSTQQMDGLYGMVFSAQPLLGASVRLIIGVELFVGLKNLALETNSSIFAVLTSSISLLFYQLTGKQDIIIGTPVSLRNREDINNLVGWFLDTLLLRSLIDEHLSVKEYIQQTAEDNSEALSHSIYPLERIMDDLDVSINLVGNVFVHLLNFEQSGSRFIDEHQRMHRPHGTPTFNVNFTFDEYDNGMELVCDYRPALFTSQTIDRILDHYLLLIKKMIVNSDSSIGNLK